MVKQTGKRNIARLEGDIVSVPLAGGRVGFGWVLKKPLMAFFDFSSKTPEVDLGQLALKPIAFQVWVIDGAVTKGMWPVIGHKELPPELRESPEFFKQDALNGRLSITKDGSERPATTAECEGLERAAVWDPEHVASRLEDRFAGRENRFVETMKLKPERVPKSS